MSDPIAANVKDRIREIVRGQRAISDLAQIGISFSRYDEICEVDNPKNLFVEVSAEDIAEGLMHFQHDAVGLQKWGTFMLGSSSFIGLDSLVNQPAGEEIIEALWDAAFEGQLPDRAIALAQA